MRVRFNYLLWLLLLLFGLLYAYGTIDEIVYGTSFPTKGLWGNLLASMIAVLLIERVVRKTELQKSERSIRYVKGKIAHTCHNLAIHLKPPSDWQERLNSAKLDWDDYFKRVLTSRMQALDELDIVLDKYSYLIEPSLRNDVFDIENLLSLWTWPALTEPTRSFEDDLWRLCNFASLTSALISKSTEIIKSHRLLEKLGYTVRYKKGESPELEPFIRPSSLVEREYRIYETYLKEAVNLRDACDEKRREYTEKRKKVT